MATTSLAFGRKPYCDCLELICGAVNAVFAYTARVKTPEGEERTVNTMVLFDIRIPMDGIYSFLIMLPLMITISIAFGYYSAYIEILRKVAPIRFRAMTPAVREVLERRGIVVEPLDRKTKKRLAKNSKQHLRLTKKRLSTLSQDDNDYIHVFGAERWAGAVGHQANVLYPEASQVKSAWAEQNDGPCF